jgi:hypothetical protein
MVQVCDVPGFRVPQGMDVAVWVQALSENTPTFILVIVPEAGIDWIVLTNAEVLRVNIIPVTAMAITAIVDSFL